MQVLKSQHRLEGHKLGVFSVDVDASGTRAVSSSVDSQIKVWDLEKGELVKDIDPGAGRLWLGILLFKPLFRSLHLFFL